MDDTAIGKNGPAAGGSALEGLNFGSQRPSQRISSLREICF
jgi:hypothetical protein